MGRLKFIVIAGPLLAAAALQASEGLVLRIRQTGDDGRGFGCYVDGESIPIQLEFTNAGSESASLRVVEHDRNGNREPFPEGLQVRVVDGKGQVLTAHDLSLGEEQREWWTSQYLSSTLSLATDVDMPGSRIAIDPGGRVRRVYDVTRVATGCPSCPLCLPGTYFIELRLGVLRSNQYKIVIRGKAEKCD